jgi:hypothetical protein
MLRVQGMFHHFAVAGPGSVHLQGRERFSSPASTEAVLSEIRQCSGINRFLPFNPLLFHGIPGQKIRVPIPKGNARASFVVVISTPFIFISYPSPPELLFSFFNTS